ncbi:Uncharacterized protein FKW44_010108 [Caligus rogercresseyi]|uniref:Uncharacterized protein n=1 Tax=Caligus rogercresseyi TaxID=217165 RepID=A0A7T8K7T4_CALRO|nr:Uncharacterized protein FKW44_010108 [Caligus rogercresseyi]
MSVYRIGKKDNIERKSGSGSKAKVDLQVIKKYGGGTTEINEGSCKGHGDLAHNDCEVGQTAWGEEFGEGGEAASH